MTRAYLNEKRAVDEGAGPKLPPRQVLAQLHWRPPDVGLMSGKRQYAKLIEVDLSTQTMRAVEGGREVFAFNCVTGSKDHPTEPGQFRILRKSPNHVSKAYNAAMHWALFFSTDGKAFHQYHGVVPLSVVRAFKETVTDLVGSHGCVRLTEQDAKALYQWADFRTQVIISGKLT